MYSRTWRTSERRYNVLVERDVRIPTGDGVEISADIFRPDSREKFPAILGAHCYAQSPQSAPIKPNSFSSFVFLHPNEERGRGWLEAGDPEFYARRGYVQVIANVRGTGKSGGRYLWLGPREVQDIYEVIEWLAKQEWCTGKVGMFGVSYFAMIQIRVAALRPPSLGCIFAPWGLTDYYRDSYYHGGILRFQRAVAFPYEISNGRFVNFAREELGEQGFQEAAGAALEDENIAGVPKLVDILKNPDQGPNTFTANILLNPLDAPFWKERTPDYSKITVPAYIGGCWANYGLHLPGAFRSWENLKGQKMMLIGPPIYIDRPVYQLQYESLRWFDYWLKGVDTAIMDEAPVRLFVEGTNRWRESSDWPLPETKWVPFYLHEGGLLSEHEYWPHEGSDSFEDSQWQRGSLQYLSPPLVEDTEVIGPIALNLYASSTDTDIFWNVYLKEIDGKGNEKLLTRGWLKGSHREIDEERSQPWTPHHPHTREEPLIPNTIYEFNIEVIPTANLFKAGSRILLKISCTDEVPKDSIEALSGGHLKRQSSSRITVFHDADRPSHVLLPITMGNLMGTFLSGGRPYVNG
jgi:hypothetical protein